MSTQYTPSLKLALPVTGELDGTWGNVVNDEITSMVEEAISGLVTINTWSANSHTLTVIDGATSESRAAMLLLDDDGLGNPSAAAEVICPAITKIYLVINQSGQSVTFKTPSGTGVVIPAGRSTWVYCDGTNVLFAAGLTPAGDVVGTTDTQTLTNKTLSSPTLTTAPLLNGSWRSNPTAVSALNIDCSLGNYFTKTISANSTFTVSNVPSGVVYSLILELTHTSGAVTWWSGVVWPDNLAPTLVDGRVSLLMFITDDGGTTWRGSSILNYLS
jgi:hypothetical protein